MDLDDSLPLGEGLSDINLGSPAATEWIDRKHGAC